MFVQAIGGKAFHEACWYVVRRRQPLTGLPLTTINLITAQFLLHGPFSFVIVKTSRLCYHREPQAVGLYERYQSLQIHSYFPYCARMADYQKNFFSTSSRLSACRIDGLFAVPIQGAHQHVLLETRHHVQ